MTIVDFLNWLYADVWHFIYFVGFCATIGAFARPSVTVKHTTK